ncbi:glycosyltransferase [Corynebacterium guangdongense]|uniref:GT2 family glycosyltransferase n=1 Tax=Corynebacterium guangdongense TaxID=1783348 RepID=A0ABU2A2X5_9CORY|nr:glycosyltransferase [Corynebacterium guangdongense]MDR7330852.1 GT2 family glycosyltransferase [Corynebacterium guangdongense]WJZ16867.1 UDP-Gal:alpha-D-GlcNAc-diphosphoundecaprenol beta-1,3-galactosyltransferase [Corynebacterium guangdongense]
MTSLAALITVYHRIDPAELTEALDSLVAQSRPADEIVIVEDGPLPPELAAVIEGFVSDRPEARVVKLARNHGAGPASQAGLDTIHTDWLARLDADDVAHPERFERQLSYAAAHPEVDVIGTAVAEFDASADAPGKVRALPATHEEIARYAKLNSPVNNPSVMMRSEAVDKVGGYRDVHHMEDYDLYARLLAGGYRFVNLPEALTFFRVDDAQFARRTGTGMFAAEREMQRNLVAYGLISRPRAWANTVIRMAYRALPKALITRVYSRLFHRQRVD